jgi:hypothetical protein
LRQKIRAQLFQGKGRLLLPLVWQKMEITHPSSVFIAKVGISPLSVEYGVDLLMFYYIGFHKIRKPRRRHFDNCVLSCDNALPARKRIFYQMTKGWSNVGLGISAGEVRFWLFGCWIG